MKKVLQTVSGAIAGTTIFISNAFAMFNDDTGNITGLSTETNLKGGITRFINSILDFILIIAVVYVIVAGLRLIISGGDEGEKDKAKTTIIFVAAGIIVILLARVIVLFVNNLL